MADRKERRFSRRRLLAGGAAAAPALALLHEAVPHRGLHGALGGSQATAAGTPNGAHPGHGGTDGAVAHATFAGGTVDHRANGFNPTEILRDFEHGKARRLASGRVLREFELVAADKEIEVAPGVKFAAWTYNGRVPGPTLRCREGELLRIRFANGSEHPHTVHFHGIHAAAMDGVPGIGERRGGGLIEPGKSYTYEFDASPFGLHLYHCHVMPLESHISKGLYGAFIVDPRRGRPKADELLMVMNGFDTNFDGSNEVYAVNTVGFHYMDEPVRVRRGELVRIYLVNTLEFDPINSFHIHANFFHYYPTGTSLEPTELTDTVVQAQGQRGILELRFPKSGRYMFHAHVSEFAQLGWMGFFEVEG
ncbi:MAG TPA: multicopper oxidase domain-containing protein [Solirubrobacterales bacterium]|nr:multicopper oxidase domain-containing protein [Solirubrobacterales bacterium]